MIRKLISILLITMIISSLSSCQSTGTKPTIINKEDRPVVAMVVDVKGFGYNPSNDAALAGLEKAKSDFGIDIVIYEPATVEEYEETMQMAVDNGADLVISKGLQMADATKSVAEANPDVKFAIFDFPEIV
jgi:basic membrane protein A